MTLYGSTRSVGETGVVNSAEFRVIAAHELDVAKRDGRHLCILWVRVDRRGPVALEEATVARSELRTLAELIADELRASDVVGITGEHELSVLLPETELAQVEVVLDHLRESILDLVAASPRALVAKVSVAGYAPGAGELSLAALFASARAQLSTRS